MARGWHAVGAFLVGGTTFVGIWIYALASWGLLFGLMFGWIPAAIGGVVLGFMWPVLAFGALVLYAISH